MNLSDRRLDLQVALLLIGMVALWTLACGLSHSAPDLDGMEELVWASSLELGYTKHPPLPTWLMHVFTQILGRPVWLTFFVGQLTSALALWFLWLLGKDLTTARNAFIVVLIGSTNLYFSLRGTIFNHNTAQLWSIIASTWLFYRAVTYQHTRYWVWLGIVAGLSMLTKYSAVIQFFAFFMFALSQGVLAQRSTWKGIGWAALAFGVVMLPHFLWLVSSQFAPFMYADEALQAGGRARALTLILRFTLDQLARLSPMIVVWLGWWIWRHRTQPRHEAGTTVIKDPPLANGMSRWNRSFLLWVGLTPFLSTVLVSALLGTRLTASWASTFFVLYSFYFLWILKGDADTVKRQITIIVVAVHLLLAVGYGVARGPLAWHTGRDSRSVFPGPEIAAEMNRIWREHVPSVPLRLVASDTWLGGNIAIHSSPQTQVLIEGRFSESPWLNPDTALDCGVLIVYSHVSRRSPSAAVLRLYEQARWKGLAEMRWSSEKSPMLDLNWAIIAPNDRCAIRAP
jgi:4-amino-4-deoxy-L-arabinose transferase-like glycosyltransferase